MEINVPKLYPKNEGTTLPVGPILTGAKVLVIWLHAAIEPYPTGFQIGRICHALTEC
jgi:hypothetical protein